MTRIPSTNQSSRIWFCGVALGAGSTLLACGGPVPIGISSETGGSSGAWLQRRGWDSPQHEWFRHWVRGEHGRRGRRWQHLR